MKTDPIFESEEYDKIEKFCRKALRSEPNSHWLWTQLGSAIYEQRRYEESLAPLRKAMELHPFCPLTRWHLAGTLHALGKNEEAAALYRELVASQVSYLDDPCWEDEEWTASLKKDCRERLEQIVGA